MFRANSCNLDWLRRLIVYIQVDKHTFKYRSDICRKMVIHLNQEGLAGSPAGKSAARSLVRQRLKAFSSALDDTIRTHGNWVIQHESLRDATRLYVTENVVSPYRGYLESFGHLLEGPFSSSSKYVKYSPEMVEQLLGGLFSPSRRPQHNSSSRSDGSWTEQNDVRAYLRLWSISLILHDFFKISSWPS